MARSTDVTLPVVNAGDKQRRTTWGGGDGHPVAKSRSAPRRAWVLAIVQVLMIVHILQWVVTGETVSPVEPSESMEFVKHGVVNAGLIFFVLALLATLVFGRWFCGWGCHLVMLQDLCGWLLNRAGIRPKPFRSRLLIYVPLLLAFYMFLWPAVYRWGWVPLDQWMGQTLGAENWLVRSERWVGALIGVPLNRTALPAWHVTSAVTTADFWGTFAGVAVAIPFLFVCGFAAVYFLGAKGFCTYGCPYGGFFAPLDKIALGSIRVTDACEQCGHCTAVCTSNVRVHEEVHAHGMVVDPGCMKCLDCVSVCPNDALYFGFGRPTALAGAPRHEPARRIHDLSWPEEIGLAGAFALTFFSVRGVYGLIPMLMAAGVAGCVTFLVWKLWRMFRDDNVSLHRFRLKYRRRVTRSGWVMLGLVGCVVAIVLHCGFVRFGLATAERHAAKADRAPEVVFGPSPSPMTEPMLGHANRALRWYGLVSGFPEGGLGLPANWQPEIDLRIARLHAAKLDFTAAEATLRRAVERDERTERFVSSLAWVLRAQERNDEALDLYRKTLLEELAYHQLLGEMVPWAGAVGATPVAIEVCEQRLRMAPDDVPTLRWLSVLRLQADRTEEGIELIRKVIEIEPEDVSAHQTLAAALAQQGRWKEAEEGLQTALAQHPHQPGLHFQMADVLDRLGSPEAAARHRLTAQRLAERATLHP